MANRLGRRLVTKGAALLPLLLLLATGTMAGQQSRKDFWKVNPARKAAPHTPQYKGLGDFIQC
jgi:hypothetical protein